MSLLLVVALVFLLCILGLCFSAGASENKPAQLAEPVFAGIYGSLSPAPKLMVSSSYGYPAFEVTFISKAAFGQAATLNQDFKREINRVFRGYGSVGRPFDAELAVFFTYPGHIDELLAGFGGDTKRVIPKPQIH